MSTLTSVPIADETLFVDCSLPVRWPVTKPMAEELRANASARNTTPTIRNVRKLVKRLNLPVLGWVRNIWLSTLYTLFTRNIAVMMNDTRPNIPSPMALLENWLTNPIS